MLTRWTFALLGIFLVFTIASCAQMDEGDPDLTDSPPGSPASTITAAPTHPPANAPTHTPINFPTPTEISSELPLQPALSAQDCLAAALPGIACTGVSKNDPWEPFVREFNTIEMVLVPAGCFQMGSDSSFAEEQPAHRICLEQPFWIDRTEVTVAQFAEFLNGQPEFVESYDRWLNVWGTTPDLLHFQFVLQDQVWTPANPKDQIPLEHATWIGATEFCAWREVRLPTEAEWEYAARGPDNRLYPWGDELVKEYVVVYRGKNPQVGSKPAGASWVGALDMIGSVFEWTSSLSKPYPYDALDGREASLAEDSVSNRVFRGSPWYHSDQQVFDLVFLTARFDAPPDFANWYYGFRCARSID